jgi:hypothetical protein
MEAPKIIRNPIANCDAGRKKVVEGIISSAYLTTFQHQAMDGIIKSSMTPAETKEAKAPKSCKAKTRKADAMATPQQIGMVHFPGSPYPRRR